MIIQNLNSLFIQINMASAPTCCPKVFSFTKASLRTVCTCCTVVMTELKRVTGSDFVTLSKLIKEQKKKLFLMCSYISSSINDACHGYKTMLRFLFFLFFCSVLIYLVWQPICSIVQFLFHRLTLLCFPLCPRPFLQLSSTLVHLLWAPSAPWRQKGKPALGEGAIRWWWCWWGMRRRVWRMVFPECQHPHMCTFNLHISTHTYVHTHTHWRSSSVAATVPTGAHTKM